MYLKWKKKFRSPSNFGGDQLMAMEWTLPVCCSYICHTSSSQISFISNMQNSQQMLAW
jgi:hypothetical protein